MSQEIDVGGKCLEAKVYKRSHCFPVSIKDTFFTHKSVLIYQRSMVELKVITRDHIHILKRQKSIYLNAK